MALEEQMEMNFGKVPDNTVAVDPVSGNDIPMGATAENVRDDVPAMLSEGEIVVPCLLYTSPSPRDGLLSRMPSSA